MGGLAQIAMNANDWRRTGAVPGCSPQNGSTQLNVHEYGGCIIQAVLYHTSI
jgi:hypothetical protein